MTKPIRTGVAYVRGPHRMRLRRYDAVQAQYFPMATSPLAGRGQKIKYAVISSHFTFAGAYRAVRKLNAGSGRTTP